MDTRLHKKLSEVAERYSQLRSYWSLTLVWLLAAALCGALLLSNRGQLPYPLVVALGLFLGTALFAGLAFSLVRRSKRSSLQVARRLEEQYPELDASLLAAVAQEQACQGERVGFLQSAVINRVLRHARRNHWSDSVSPRRLRTAMALQWMSAAVFVVLVVLVARSPGTNRSSGAGAAGGATMDRLSSGVQVVPGDTEIEKGGALLVSAHFDPNEVPAEARLVFQAGDESPTTVPMRQSLDDPVFGGRLASVNQPLTYHLEFAGRRTDDYHVGIFEFPRLIRADALLSFPAYTSLPDELVQDTRRITAVVGTEITLLCTLNKPVERAMLVRVEPGAALALTVDPADSQVVRLTFVLSESNRFRLHLEDDAGRANKNSPLFSFRAVPNQPPKLEMLAAGDERVSPLEELVVRVKMSDDFGMPAYGVSTMKGGEPAVDTSLGEPSGRRENRTLEHVVDFEALEAEPDDLVSYYFWAEDQGPDGVRRRTLSDMFFAEVRPFEEIFRQGEAPARGEERNQQQQDQERNREQQDQQGGQGQEAEELAERQKEIINATWKILRSQSEPTSGESLVEDSALVRDTQADLLDQVTGLSAQLLDEESVRAGGEVIQHMQGAVERLTEVVDQESPDELSPALARERAAYQALLRLRAREVQVARTERQQQGDPSQQQEGQGNRQGNRSRQQLDQLELNNSQNRYETQRTAQRRLDENSQRSQEQREDRQVLNRLRELAQRQQDVNEEMQELRSELEAAETEEEREELARRLKRLGEEEEELLRNTDELRERMDQPANQDRLAESREQLDSTRENVRRASEALRAGDLSEAITEGTRAERELEELRDVMRQRTANEFADEMRRMREEAESLDEREQQLARAMDEVNRSQRSLRDTSEREDLARGFEQQADDLDGLLERMQQSMEEAETDEPLLAEELYETLKQEREDRVTDALEDVRELIERGFLDELPAAEQPVGEGLSRLREGVGRAAERILGNGDEALQRAYEELERLAEDLGDEVARARPEDPDGQRDSDPNAQQQPGDPQPGDQQRGGQSPDGQQRAGQRQQGEPRDGQRPSGESGRPGGRRLTEDNRRGGNSNARLPEDRDGRPGQEEGDPASPLTGEDFLDWSDRLRDVEEMIDDADLRAEAARVRSRARSVRLDVKRHSKEPDWDLVVDHILHPLNELRDRVGEELQQRRSRDALVPIDRDPVPPEFEDDVRRYYEKLAEEAVTAPVLTLTWSTTWLVPVLVLGAAALAVLFWSYRYPLPGFSKRLLCGVLKAFGVAALMLCLLEPKQSGLRPRPRANLVLALVDDSRSMQIRDADQEATRGELLKEALNPESRWLTRLEQDFDTRRYLFHARMRSFAETAELTQEGDQSAMAAALSSVADRFRDRPVAAVLLFTDGNATDFIGESIPWDRLPPIYPVDVCGDGPKRDLGFRHVSVSQTNFEQNPVTVRVEVSTWGYTTEELVVELLDEDGRLVTSQTLTAADEGKTSSLRLQVQPGSEGATCFYALRVREKDQTETFESHFDSDEATLANNQRWIMVDRGRGPYRVLYVSGRPNWEFKFLRRALEADREVELVGLIRIARKEPRFAYRDSRLGTRSQLYKGFETNTDEGAEAYDEPVLLRLGTLDEVELREGFPKKAEDLYGYHAILLDDVEAEFFTADQQTLIREFVSKRGGGLLLLGGEQSFLKGRYEHTPLEDLAPVYLDAPSERVAPDEFRVMLTREGWLEPWVRLRSSEDLERQRLGGMPPFRTVNRVGDVKPGAIALLTSLDERGTSRPALVTQRFGLGRSAALMIADMWRWDMRRETPEESDLGRAWRQIVRWLVADVPGRITVEVGRPEASGRNVRLDVTARDETHLPLDNAQVTVEFEAADGESLQIRAEPTDQEAGSFYVDYRPVREGPHRAIVKVSNPDGSEVGEREVGWVTEPAQAEFQRIDANRALLATLAERTGGEVLSMDGLDDFVTGLSRQKVPVTEQRIYPLWHHWWVFLFAVLCFCAEWALRRTQGLP